MKIIYIIQDVKTKEYFGQYRIDEYFTKNVYDAKHFSSRKSLMEELSLDYIKDFLNDRILEIKEYLIL